MNKVVYRHRRSDTNEVFYIGMGTPERPYVDYGRNNLWNKIVSKTDYTVEVVAENLTLEDACELEMLLISEYGRIDQGTGCLCNFTDGGEGTLNITAENRLAVANSNKNRVWSEESRKKVSDRVKGTKKADVSKYLGNRNGVGGKSKSKIVLDTQTGIYYSNAKEASELLGYKHSTLMAWLRTPRLNKTNLIYA